VASAWGVTLLLGYGALGPWLGGLVEGISPGQLPRWSLPSTALAGVIALVLSVLWARPEHPASPDDASATALDRRRFLTRALGVGAGGLAGSVAAALARNAGWLRVGPAVTVSVPTESTPRSQWQGARIQSYRRLGRTGFEISDISLGSAAIRPETGGEQIARRLIERGVNYFDTAPDYSAEGSETALGRARQGQRERMFIATKFCTASGHLGAGASPQEYVAAVEGSLRRLRTDYVDLIHIHACDSVERLLSESAHEAFERLKQAGKVRFLGVSTHTPNLEAVAGAAIESGRFDVIMLAYHHGAWPQLSQIIERAAAADIGVVAMKTLKGAHHEGLLDFVGERDSYPQAAFRWVLQNPHVSGLVISFRKPEHVEEYLFASGQSPQPGDQAVLAKYDRLIAGKHCFAHCGACLSACPEGLPIHDVLRHRMYFEDYGEQREAMRLYSQLPVQASVCLGCSGPCLGACPHGVAIRERTIGAHQLLA
jgi:aryl-alcohol dehydrogenase-like predicted oxidoreductase